MSLLIGGSIFSTTATCSASRRTWTVMEAGTASSAARARPKGGAGWPAGTQVEILSFPASADGPWAKYVHDPDARGIGTTRYPRTVAKEEECAKELKRRTLTNLYNQRPAWLEHAHRRLDEAVFAASGWPADLSDEDLLPRLLELNLAREGSK